jgi:uncharacterized LabA/DUF88 family protein
MEVINTIDKLGYILIDFDNFIKKPIEEILEKDIEYHFILFIQKLLSENKKYERIIIRLYGGWYQEGILSKRGQQLQQKISKISLFPFPDKEGKNLIRGKIELAESILSTPEIVWDNTYLEKNGIPSLRIDNDKISDICKNNREHCPIYIIKSFTKNKRKICKVESCNNIHRDIFFQRGQKMVDTMIACDLQYCSFQKNIQNAILISSDTDLIPALIQSNSMSFSDETEIEKKIIFGFDIKKEVAFNRYIPLFNNFNIKTFDYEY